MKNTSFYLLLIPILLVLVAITFAVISPNESAMTLLAVLLLPVSIPPAVFHLKIQPGTTKKIACYSGAISFSYLVMAVFLKVQHFPGGDWSLLLGVFMLVMLFIPFVFKHLYEKKSVN